MKQKVQQEIFEELKRVLSQNPENKWCQQWALSVAEKQKTKFACFRYDKDDVSAYYIDPSAEYIKVDLNDGSSPVKHYLLFAIKRYN